MKTIHHNQFPTQGATNLVDTAAACCAQCAALPGCNVWVWCGDAMRCPAALHRSCWLKKQPLALGEAPAIRDQARVVKTPFVSPYPQPTQRLPLLFQSAHSRPPGAAGSNLRVDVRLLRTLYPGEPAAAARAAAAWLGGPGRGSGGLGAEGARRGHLQRGAAGEKGFVKWGRKRAARPE